MCLLACWSRPDSDSRRGMKRSACSGFEHISATLRHHRYMLRGCTEPQAPSSALPVGTSFRSPCAYTSAPSLHLSTTAFNEGLGRGFLSESKRDSQSKCPASNSHPPRRGLQQQSRQSYVTVILCRLASADVYAVYARPCDKDRVPGLCTSMLSPGVLPSGIVR